MDAIPGTPLIDGAVSFSLSSTSKPVYVRAKISYSGDASLNDYLTALRSATNYGFATGVSGTEWTTKSGNYVYLVQSSDTTALKKVDDTTTYNLTSSFSLPTDITNLPNNAQYMAQIQFHIEFQAIQADNLGNMAQSDIKDTFNDLFPESEGEKYTPSNGGGQGGNENPQSQATYSTLRGAESNAGSSTNFLGVTGLQRDTIKTLTFSGASATNLNSGALVSGALSDAPVGYTISADVSAAGDNSIMLYAVENALDNTKYDVTICSDAVIKLPADCSYLFCWLDSSTSVNLTNVDMSDVTDIYCMFYNCTGLTSFSIPSGVEGITDKTFKGCTNLTNITIPSSVEMIGGYAFADCTNLTYITIPSSVEGINGDAFYGCSNLTDIYYAGTSTQWSLLVGDLEGIGLDSYEVTIHYESSGPITNLTNTTWLFNETVQWPGVVDYYVNYSITCENSEYNSGNGTYLLFNLFSSHGQSKLSYISNNSQVSNAPDDPPVEPPIGPGSYFYVLQINTDGATQFWSEMAAESIFEGIDTTTMSKTSAHSPTTIETITITGGTDATNADLIAWLQANATLQ